jgi:site-specific DNA-methyltransferase (adenine-specific)
LAVAVEDAGFELRDSIAWIYGSGFPKSLDVSKAIDKRAGEKRQRYRFSETSTRVNTYAMDAWSVANVGTRLVDDPITDDAHTWKGWGTALKPAHEPVVVGRKPLVGTVAENVLAWGVGGLNIDGSRIGFRNEADKNTVQGAQWHAVPNDTYGKFQRQHDREVMNGADSTPDKGRWPANVIFDEVTAGLLDEQSGTTSAGKGKSIATNTGASVWIDQKGRHTPGRTTEFERYGDVGGASRFFYVAKASKRDRNEGLEELEAQRHADRVVDDGPGGENPRNRTNQAKQNFHPTVKPTALMRYLIKLVTPEGGVVLDPFTGSGSTGKAALLDGFQFVGIELTEEYLPIIEGRLRWASEQVEDDGTLF